MAYEHMDDDQLAGFRSTMQRQADQTACTLEMIAERVRGIDAEIKRRRGWTTEDSIADMERVERDLDERRG